MSDYYSTYGAYDSMHPKNKGEMKMDIYITCEKCSHENFVDNSSEIHPINYSCDECGKPLETEVKAAIHDGVLKPLKSQSK